jgi:hypothetical protein
MHDMLNHGPLRTAADPQDRVDEAQHERWTPRRIGRPVEEGNNGVEIGVDTVASSALNRLIQVYPRPAPCLA